MNTVLVCGGREFTDWQYMWGVLDALHVFDPIERLVNGGARGADYYSTLWANARGVPVKTYAVVKDDWGKYGKAAGVIRNKGMLKDAQPSLVVAFKGNTGTKSMVDIAMKAHIDVLIMSYPSDPSPQPRLEV